MLVRYYIPEDGDDAKHPNVFAVPGNNRNLTLAEIIEAFPVPGSFHFRFYKSIGNSAVWMDINDESSPVPTYQGNIIIKATRLFDDYVEPVAPKPVPSSAPIKNPTPPAQPNNSTPVSAPAVPPKPVKQNSEKSELLNFSEDTFDGPSKTQPGASVFDDSNDLLGFTSSSHSNSTLPSNHSKGDLFGLDTLQPTPSSGNIKPAPINNAFNGMGAPGPSMVPPRGGMGAPLGTRPLNSIDPFDSLNMNSGSSKGQMPTGFNNQYGMPPRRNF